MRLKRKELIELFDAATFSIQWDRDNPEFDMGGSTKILVKVRKKITKILNHGKKR